MVSAIAMHFLVSCTKFLGKMFARQDFAQNVCIRSTACSFLRMLGEPYSLIRVVIQHLKVGQVIIFQGHVGMIRFKHDIAAPYPSPQSGQRWWSLFIHSVDIPELVWHRGPLTFCDHKEAGDTSIHCQF